MKPTTATADLTYQTSGGLRHSNIRSMLYVVIIILLYNNKTRSIAGARLQGTGRRRRLPLRGTGHLDNGARRSLWVSDGGGSDVSGYT